MNSNSDISSNSTSVLRDHVEDTELPHFINELKLQLELDLLACDMKWILFVAAARSYRYDSVLRPFPPAYLNPDDKSCDIDRLIHIIDEVPSLNLVLQRINKNYRELKKEVVQLLYWVLVKSIDPQLKTIKKELFPEVLKKVPTIYPVITPHYIFKVCPSTQNVAAEQKFLNHTKDFPTNFAFHGSKLECFHSILNYGLNQHLSKIAVFGDGTYLSSEHSVSLMYSPSGSSWGASHLGSYISCLAICEYVEHPQYLKCNTIDERDPHMKRIRGTDVPEKYFIVRNNEIVRIRYLLVYSRQNSTPRNFSDGTVEMGWFARNKSVLSVCCYAILLGMIGIMNSEQGRTFRFRAIREFWRFYETLFGS